MTLLTSHPDSFEKPQDDEIVLSVKNVSKRFCRDLKRSLFYGIQDIAGEVFGARRKDVELRKGEFWALNDVSFELRRGEALGLVGGNGAGKTTLLRIISGLIKPDHGSVEIKGRVAPLIALGAGFNPVLTGRENIYVNMSILGLSKEEIDERFDQVVEFAEIGEAIDAPVQSYSSGMAARLGFASAIHTEPDIFIIDEVLAVGDIKFRAKCYRKLNSLRETKTSILMVSHDPEAICATCNSALYLKLGSRVSSGETTEVMQKYQEDLFTSETPSKIDGNWVFNQKHISYSKGLDIVEIYLKNINNEAVKHLITGESASFSIKLFSHKRFENLCVRILIKNNSNDILFLDSLKDSHVFIADIGLNNFILNMPYLGLNPGKYIMNIWILEGRLNVLDLADNLHFIVLHNSNQGNSIRNLYNQNRLWEMKSLE